MSVVESSGAVRSIVFNQSAAAAHDVAAAETGLKQRVLAVELTSAGTCAVTFQSKTTPTVVSGPHPLVANGRLSMPFNPCGHFESLSGQALQILLGSAVQVSGHIVVQSVP